MDPIIITNPRADLEALKRCGKNMRVQAIDSPPIQGKMLGPTMIRSTWHTSMAACSCLPASVCTQQAVVQEVWSELRRWIPWSASRLTTTPANLGTPACVEAAHFLQQRADARAVCEQLYPQTCDDCTSRLGAGPRSLLRQRE